MNYYCNPLNVEYKYQFIERDGGKSISREAADPSLILFKDMYYLFPSMTGGFFYSQDLFTWEYQAFDREMPIYDYAPDVRVIDDFIYFCASKHEGICDFYRTKDPLGGEFEKIEGTFSFWDPNLFVDEDGRIYLYWGCSNTDPLYGVELNPKDMKPIGEKITLMGSKEQEIGYERNGEDHIPPKTQEQIEQSVQTMLSNFKKMGREIPEEMLPQLYARMGNAPYFEGAWMTKYQEKYYLQYAAPGTQYNVYADGVYVSQSPLGPFTLAKNNPYSYKPGGFMQGAGHGSTLQDKKGNWWHASTMRVSMNQMFERRLGLWQAGFDENGELFCDQRYGDWPIAMNQKPWDKPHWMLLSYKKPITVSSGTNPSAACDENSRTWWSAEGEKGEWLLMDLKRMSMIHGVQINFADQVKEAWIPENEKLVKEANSMRYLDKEKRRTRWLLEVSIDGQNFDTLIDKRVVNTDLAHDFIAFDEAVTTRYIRLTIEELPFHQKACVSGLRVFGIVKGTLPKKVSEVVATRTGDLDMTVSWKATDAIGYNILWGYAPDKLYHSYMVFDKTHQNIGALIKDEQVYVRVDCFNESGITEGIVEAAVVHFR
jgi:hypothetical protein